MKLFTGINLTFLVLASLAMASAFVLVPSGARGCQENRPIAISSTIRRSAIELHMTLSSRRALIVATGTAAIASFRQPSESLAADLNYSKLQDLLNSPSQSYNPSTGRPTYLAEPTEEFKENEAKSSQFKRDQLRRKQEFSQLLTQLQEVPNDEQTLVKVLKDLRRLVQAQQGLPLGITKSEVVQQARRRKSKKYWPTNVEIAYQDLVNEILYQQSPNTGKDYDSDEVFL